MLAFLFSSDMFGACSMPTQAWSLRSPYAVVALSHNLAVVFRHLQEVSNSHAALVTLFTTANRDNTIGNFLLDSFGVPTAAARQCPRKRGRCSRLGRLSPTIRMKKNVGSKEPTFANVFRLLTSERLFCHQRSFRGTGQRSFDPYRLPFSC